MNSFDVWIIQGLTVPAPHVDIQGLTVPAPHVDVKRTIWKSLKVQNKETRSKKKK